MYYSYFIFLKRRKVHGNVARWSLPRQWCCGYSVWIVLWRSLQHQQNDGELSTRLCAVMTSPLGVVAFWGRWVVMQQYVRLYKTCCSSNLLLSCVAFFFIFIFYFLCNPCFVFCSATTETAFFFVWEKKKIPKD